MTIDLSKLAAHFPRDKVSWRAQTVTKNGDKALALAYIDARDVQDRLNDVCGPENWQNRYPHVGGKTVCEIGIRIGEEWVWKSDGAGDSDVEAEKGALSDAFKRAAVKWGIGRYLYDLDSPWVPCESREWNGKRQFVKFTADPWQHVRGAPAPQRQAEPPPAAKPQAAPDESSHRPVFDIGKEALLMTKTLKEYNAWIDDNGAMLAQLEKAAPKLFAELCSIGEAHLRGLQAKSPPIRMAG